MEAWVETASTLGEIAERNDLPSPLIYQGVHLHAILCLNIIAEMCSFPHDFYA